MICETIDDCDFFDGCCGYAFDKLEVIERVCSGENSKEPAHMYELKNEGFAEAEFSCDLAAAEEAIALADSEHATKKLAIVTATILGLLYNMWIQFY